MGQTNSRYHQDSNEDTATSSTPPVVGGASTDMPPESPSDASAETPPAHRTRRSSIRKNIINLVKPGGTRNRTNNSSNISPDRKRSWRNSRRSKTQQDSNSPCPVIVEPSTSSSSDNSLAGPSNIHSIPLDKGKQREPRAGADEDDQEVDNKILSVSHNTLLSSVPVLPDVDSNKASSTAASSHTASDSLHADSQPEAGNHLPLPHASISSELSTNDAPVVESGDSVRGDHVSPLQEEQSIPQPQPSPRQFPPPGTLVVVQGIVHTTDVRPPDLTGNTPAGADLTPTQSLLSPPRLEGTAEQSSRRLRNRLSTLLRSRSGGHNSNFGQVSASNSLSHTATAEPNASTAGSTVPSVIPPRAQPIAPFFSPMPRPTQDMPSRRISQRLPTTDSHPSAISPGSIDVLGTLLSVAAAATAASLLTGSSEPILSSGLTAPGTNSSSPLTNTPPSAPSIPNLPSYTGVPPTDSGIPDITAAGRAERMREAWGAIRQRLGLRPSPSGSAVQEGNADDRLSPETVPTTSGYGSLTDTRELMLAEMARAFNHGLGLNGLGGLTPTANPDAATSEPAADAQEPSTNVPVIPSEGSFERFLIDLQIDLRLALTPDPQEQESQQQVSPEHEYTAPPNGHSTRPDTPRPEATDEGMPGLADAVNSDSDEGEDEDEEDDEYQSADHGSAQGPSIEGSSFSRTRLPSSGTSHIDESGRINWWRLYRFPPIPTPAGVRPVPGSPNPVPTTNTMNSGTSAPAGTESLPNQTPAPLPSVVPVIIVGLQSVDAEWRDMPGENDDADLFGAHNSDVHADGNEAAAGDGAEPDNLGPDGTRTARTRGWHARAANALRNLRPSRRNADASLGPQSSIFMPGTRTFLIYVIGGYYAPDHSIVTGGPNILDSFEALLELADLLGQVKTPTASKDDLEKSGLEIIKASEVPQHEKEGKISSNCTDRCLICLDDYEPEDRVRVMTCRHAFHKSCVDEWLIKGRNNCPACRSTGVATENHFSPSTSTL